jgi:hypothetical protein
MYVIPKELASFLVLVTLRYFFTISMSVNQLKKKLVNHITKKGRALSKPFCNSNKIFDIWLVNKYINFNSVKKTRNNHVGYYEHLTQSQILLKSKTYRTINQKKT